MASVIRRSVDHSPTSCTQIIFARPTQSDVCQAESPETVRQIKTDELGTKSEANVDGSRTGSEKKASIVVKGIESCSSSVSGSTFEGTFEIDMEELQSSDFRG